jgi:hypothetical protein
MATSTLLTIRLIDADDQRMIASHTDDPSATLNADYLDHLIAGLAALREKVAPVVSTADPAPSETPGVKFDPQWWIGPETFVGGAMLKIRHPGFGWLAFAIPLENLRKLHAGVGNLLAWAEERAAGQSTN